MIADFNGDNSNSTADSHSHHHKDSTPNSSWPTHHTTPDIVDLRSKISNARLRLELVIVVQESVTHVGKQNCYLSVLTQQVIKRAVDLPRLVEIGYRTELPVPLVLTVSGRFYPLDNDLEGA